MPDVRPLLDELKGRGLSLRLDNGGLVVSPVGLLDPETTARIRQAKADIVAALSEPAGWWTGKVITPCGCGNAVFAVVETRHETVLRCVACLPRPRAGESVVGHVRRGV